MNVYIKKQNSSWQKILATAGSLAVLIIFLNFFQAEVRNSFYAASSPISNPLIYGASATSGFFSSFFTFADTKQENEALISENRQLLSQITMLQDSARQAHITNLATQTAATRSLSLAPAQIIGMDAARNTITLDKGLSDGVTENMAVISHENVAYGRVFAAYAHFSEVVLVSNASSVLNIKIQNSDPLAAPIYGAVKGSNSGAYLDLVSSDAELKEGDLLVTSGLEGIFPKDLLVGSIIAADKNDAKAFQTASIRLFFNAGNIDTLFVVTGYKK